MDPAKPTTAEKASSGPSARPSCTHRLIEPEKPQHDRDDRQDGDVGQDEENDAFHTKPPERKSTAMR